MVKDERFALTGDFDSEEDNLGEQLGEDSGSDDLSVSELGEGEDAEAAGQTAAERTAGEASTSEQGMEPGGEDPDGEVEKAGKSKKVLSEEKLKRIKDVYDKRGIVYVSRIPPHMKPQKLRQLLTQYGAINRVYCALESQSARKTRKMKGKDTGKNFVEGWVEFEDKRIAKRVALALNNKQIGGRKRSAYYYDLWSLKYLPKFKWDHLTEEINYQKAVREQKLLAEMSVAKRERDFYLSRVDKAKAVDAIKERKLKQALAAGGPGEQAASTPGASSITDAAKNGVPRAAAVGTSVAGDDGVTRMRHYGQRRAKLDPVSDASAPRMADDVLSMLAQSSKKQRTQS